MFYGIYVPKGGYVCKGSFIVQGERFKVLGNKESARRFKTEAAAINELKRMRGKYGNITNASIVVFVDLNK